MVDTIIVGVDGSPDAHRAVAWTSDVAGPLGSRVVAVHAVGLLEHERGDPDGNHLAPKLAAWTADLDRLPAGRVERRLVQGDPVSAILEAADREGADLIVVGTRGEGARTLVVVGSTSLQLAERATCPVVIVPRAAGER